MAPADGRNGPSTLPTSNRFCRLPLADGGQRERLTDKPPLRCEQGTEARLALSEALDINEPSVLPYTLLQGLDGRRVWPGKSLSIQGVVCNILC